MYNYLLFYYFKVPVYNNGLGICTQWNISPIVIVVGSGY